jgi:Tol biopolymer transport system component
MYLLIRSRDGQMLAYSRELNLENLYVSDISGTHPVQIHPSGYPTFSPDGTRLAVSRSDGLYIVNTDDTGLRRVADAGGHPSWSPDGMHIAYGRGQGGSLWSSGIYVTEVAGGPERYIATGLNPEWAPRGNRIAYLGLRGGYAAPCFVDADGSHPMCYSGFSVNGGRILWSPDGKRVAFKQASPHRLVVAAARRRHLRRFPIMKQRGRVLAWSPDGRWLAYSKQIPADNFRYQMFVRPVDRAKGERRVTNEPHPGADLFWEVVWRGEWISYVVFEP